MSGPDLEIRLLGRLDVTRDGRPMKLPRSRKARALLVRAVLADRRPSDATEHAAALRSDADGTAMLSARSRTAVLAALELLPTQITTD